MKDEKDKQVNLDGATEETTNVEETETPAKGTATAEEIEAWKKKHKAVFCIEIEELNPNMNPTGNTIIGYFRYPTRTDDEAMASTSKNNVVSAAIANYKRCFLGGDSRFVDTENSYASVVSTAIQHFSTIIQPKRAIIKNL
jgi:hypothetical protein